MSPLDPREVLRRDRERQEPAIGLVYLRTIAAEERQWMERMAVRVAADYHVEADDLLQDLRLGLLTCNSIDAGRKEFRAWITRRATWKAADLRRTLSRHDAQPLESTPDPPAPEYGRIDPDWDVDASWRLSRDEAQIVRLICWGLDYSMRDLSELMERSYDKVRKDKSRGLHKIEKLFGLSEAELAAFLAFRRFPTYPVAASHLGVSEDELRIRVRQADDKIRRVLGRSATDDPEEEGRSDAS